MRLTRSQNQKMREIYEKLGIDIVLFVETQKVF